jgi:hypothetical protein
MNTLIVVVSTKLRTKELQHVFDRERRIETEEYGVVILDDQFEFDTFKKWTDLEHDIVETIVGSTASSIYVAVHNRCLGIREIERFQKECPAETERVRQAVAGRGHRDNIAVWGFHHIEKSSIYEALTALDGWHDKSLAERNALKPRLLASFRPLTEDSVFDCLSVIKHQLMGLFSPLHLQLQLAREERLSPDKAQKRVEEVVERLPGKRQEACDLLESAKELIATTRSRMGGMPGGIDEELRYVSDLLIDRFPPLPTNAKVFLDEITNAGSKLHIDFHTWLKELDKALRSLREVAIHEES